MTLITSRASCDAKNVHCIELKSIALSGKAIVSQISIKPPASVLLCFAAIMQPPAGMQLSQLFCWTTLHTTGQHYIQHYFKSDNTSSNQTTPHTTLLQIRQYYIQHCFKSSNTTSNWTTLHQTGQHYIQHCLKSDNTTYNTTLNRTTLL